MTKPAIFFDLDGTLTDSGEGIINCATLALEHFQIPIPSREELRVFVGPPLHKTFVEFGVPEDKCWEAVAVYRSRYNTVGKFENTPYPFIRSVLETLKNAGYRLYVATSKPEALSIEIMDKFDLSRYFDKICGASTDASRSEKSQVIAYLLSQLTDVEGAVMVGDTAFDVIGAAEHKIPTVGVSWGYGKVEEMEEAGAVAIAHTGEELLQIIRNFKN